MAKIFKIFLATCIFCLFTGLAFGKTLFSDSLNWSGSDFNGSGGWQYVNFEKLSTGGVNNSGCMRDYGTGGKAYIDIEGLGNYLELYIRFYAKVEKSTAGQKWLKIFGQRADGDSSTYANVTFGRVYETGYLKQISYGASGAARDTSNVEDYNLSGLFFPSSEWTCYEYHIKFAQAPEWNNGIFEAWVDGVKVAAHYNINNRGTEQSGLYIDEINFDGYGQSSDSAIGYRYIDEVVVSTEPIGTLDSDQSNTSSLTAPENFRVQELNLTFRTSETVITKFIAQGGASL
ncbi:hypothetical protein [Desulfosarcina ovata]|uniref:3-keto-disaccharide hydrolase domain-containing protein n=1 Tax=Desulfosarcina ovata subsp. ovata TaxID=2752305 RepID=A0A5K8A7Y0_9BACT|nr:hypothetical protein [Desulfosarcina ovata]BBO88518.1 hypothetical protein DSCOOX_16980 [Desulfosarcina ovata subsp. ovata]